mmetsp:Transcript_28111/g.81066  ORF Transcript_28111/g.81066 Transcript_28111/m.81066 type:complete len:211 (-) Transcript_28111:1673-2305(-)
MRCRPSRRHARNWGAGLTDHRVAPTQRGRRLHRAQEAQPPLRLRLCPGSVVLNLRRVLLRLQGQDGGARRAGGRPRAVCRTRGPGVFRGGTRGQRHHRLLGRHGQGLGRRHGRAPGHARCRGPCCGRSRAAHGRGRHGLTGPVAARLLGHGLQAPRERGAHGHHPRHLAQLHARDHGVQRQPPEDVVTRRLRDGAAVWTPVLRLWGDALA